MRLWLVEASRPCQRKARRRWLLCGCSLSECFRCVKNWGATCTGRYDVVPRSRDCAVASGITP